MHAPVSCYLWMESPDLRLDNWFKIIHRLCLWSKREISKPTRPLSPFFWCLIDADSLDTLTHNLKAAIPCIFNGGSLLRILPHCLWFHCPDVECTWQRQDVYTNLRFLNIGFCQWSLGEHRYSYCRFLCGFNDSKPWHMAIATGSAEVVA